MISGSLAFRLQRGLRTCQRVPRQEVQPVALTFEVVPRRGFLVHGTCVGSPGYARGTIRRRRIHRRR